MITRDDLPEPRFQVGPFDPELCPELYWQAWWGDFWRRAFWPFL